MASTTPVNSLDAVTAVGTGATVDFTTAKRIVSAAIYPTSGVTDGLILIQASQDGTNWIDQAVIEVSGGRNRGYDSSAGAYRYWRANVYSKVNGGTVVATFMEADR